ncbi:hypothetical protein K9N50_05855, partial [bacterium]|nr:hypothetical protein [bacterium]
DDAVFRLFKDQKCRIKGEKATATSPSGTMQMGSTIHIDSDTTGLSVFSKRIIKIDSCRTSEMLLMLVSTRDIEINCTRIKQPSEPCNGSAVPGSAPVYLQRSSSWIEAERVARESLATGISATVKVVDRKENDRVVKTIITSTDVMLSNIQTIHRRLDKENGIVKVWVDGNRGIVR